MHKSLEFKNYFKNQLQKLSLELKLPCHLIFIFWSNHYLIPLLSLLISLALSPSCLFPRSNLKQATLESQQAKQHAHAPQHQTHARFGMQASHTRALSSLSLLHAARANQAPSWCSLSLALAQPHATSRPRDTTAPCRPRPCPHLTPPLLPRSPAFSHRRTRHPLAYRLSATTIASQR